MRALKLAELLRQAQVNFGAMTLADNAFFVSGASGQIGKFLLQELARRSQPMLALSRHAQSAHPALSNIQWLQADLQTMQEFPSAQTAISVGPLAAFARALHRCGPNSLQRIVAISSTRFFEIDNAGNPSAMALQLREAESSLQTFCIDRNIAWTVLRPTLIYGAGVDLTLSRYAHFVQRFGIAPLPTWEGGLRQPVHAQDIALACLQTLQSDTARNQCFDLPGGETLTFRQMLKRVARTSRSRTLLVPLPQFLARAVCAFPQWGPAVRQRLAATLTIFNQSKTFSAQAAKDAFVYQPRDFSPTASTWISPAAP